MQMLAPEIKDPTKDVCVRAGGGWQVLLQARQSRHSFPSFPRERNIYVILQIQEVQVSSTEDKPTTRKATQVRH